MIAHALGRVFKNSTCLLSHVFTLIFKNSTCFENSMCLLLYRFTICVLKTPRVSFQMGLHVFLKNSTCCKNSTCLLLSDGFPRVLKIPRVVKNPRVVKVPRISSFQMGERAQRRRRFRHVYARNFRRISIAGSRGR